MNENQEVSLSYQIAGQQLLRGVYRFDKNAKKLITISEPVEDVCTVKVNLSPEYCKYHSSTMARPDRSSHAKAYTRWMIMTPQDRLKWHVVKFAYDSGAIGNIKFQIS